MLKQFAGSLMYIMKINVTKFLKESNAIEGITDKDSLQQAQYAWDYIISKDKLTSKIILETHGRLMVNQDIYPHELGHFRKVPVWIGSHEAKSWYVVPELIEQWIVNANDLVINGKNENEKFLERIIKEHHVKFESIHPFVDGNGRIGRLLMLWQYVKLGLPIKIIYNKDKYRYYRWFI